MGSSNGEHKLRVRGAGSGLLFKRFTPPRTRWRNPKIVKGESPTPSLYHKKAAGCKEDVNVGKSTALEAPEVRIGGSDSL